MATAKDSFEVQEGQVPFIQRVKDVIAFKKDVCGTKMSPLRTLLSPFRDAFNHVARPFNDEW